MNDFLRRYARQSHDLGAAKTFLAIDDADQTILGFYSLAPGALAYAGTPAMLRRGLAQHDVPGFRLARIATHVRAQRQGLGGQLLAAAARRCLRAAAEVGGVVLILDAKNKRAARAGGKSASPAIGSNCCRSRRKQLRSAGCGTPLAPCGDTAFVAENGAAPGPPSAAWTRRQTSARSGCGAGRGQSPGFAG